MQKKNSKFIYLFIGLLFLIGGTVSAKDSVSISIPSGQKIDGDFIQAGETVDIAGDIAGDVILAGGNVSFSGTAGGDIIVLGGNVRIKGDAAGDVRVIGGNVTLDGEAGKNVTLLGGSVILEEDSIVKGNLYIAGENIEIRGKNENNTTVYGSQISFSGDVKKNADFRSKKIILRSDGSIEGNLVYAMSSDSSLENKQIVKGDLVQTELQDYLGGKKDNNTADSGVSFGFEIWQFLSLFVVAWIFFKLFRKQSEQLILPIQQKEVWNKIASGLLSLIFNPVIILISFFTIIGIPIALLVMFVYIILLIAASVLSPVLVGRAFNEKFKLHKTEIKNLWMDFSMGYILMLLVKVVPVLGEFALFFLFLFSFGRVTKFVYGEINKNRRAV